MIVSNSLTVPTMADEPLESFFHFPPSLPPSLSIFLRRVFCTLSEHVIFKLSFHVLIPFRLYSVDNSMRCLPHCCCQRSPLCRGRLRLSLQPVSHEWIHKEHVWRTLSATSALWYSRTSPAAAPHMALISEA